MYLAKCFQYKAGTTRKPVKRGDVLIEGRDLGLNKTCVTHLLQDATQERTLQFVKQWLSNPLGLTKTSLERLHSDVECFINSGVKGGKFLEVYTKKKNKIEIYLENA